VSSTTGLLLSYALGVIFALGGIAFIIFLDERRFLFGVPYLVIGVLLIGGVRASQRRRGLGEAEDDDAPPPAP
jgi:hypothetical protein